WDRDAGAEATRACALVAGRWCDSARYGVSDGALHRAALATVAVARAAFADVGISPSIGHACDEFVARYLARGRSPGVDVLGTWRGGEPLVRLDDGEDRWT